MPSKTPVSLLQEMLSRQGTTPKYELVQIEGAIHEPTFRYRVTVADNVAIGTGRSKKVAKHTAAKNLLDKLNGKAACEEFNISPIETGRGSPNQVINSFDKISGNPIGTLQEMCICHRWPPPVYEMTCEEGLPHERQFTMACIVFKYREVGSGKSKKLAKRQAAHKMWEKLQQCSPLPQLGYQDEVGGYNVDSMSNRFADVKNSKISTLTNPHGHKVSMFHKNLKQSNGPVLNKLQIFSSVDKNNFDPIAFLQEIATEQHFEVTYVNIEETTVSGKCQCLVQLSVLPVAVCHGTGSTSSEAQSDSALNALEYLKIMTKK
ncbi:tar RNA binding protein, putative [Pediculus humanus corporis]|uniref:Tar RNA binding protein, putative n=1 Tax=Pediculus humanus subsp. corporis TaxID=121224 RepID=E0W0M6_PEDHC|nr:tar RNA binding protein, putative [Pediculus humanus corporis]EEB19182.1 tar RNA binding protein, putative [Pediculus humanus corporis]